MLTPAPAPRAPRRPPWAALLWAAGLACASPDPASPPGGADATGPTDTAAPADVRPTFAPAPIDADPLWWDLFRRDRVHPVEVRLSGAEWDALNQDMRDYAAIDPAMRTGRYRRATFVYTRADGGEEVVADVGFRTRGNTTRVIPQDEDGRFHRAHFKVRFNEAFDLPPGDPAHAARRDRRWRSLRALNLKWPANDPTQIRELYGYELMHRVGVRAPRTAPVALTVTIDGAPVYFGLYLAVEEVDRGFLTTRYGRAGADGDLYKCLWQHHGPATLQPITDPRAVGVKDWERNYRPAYDLTTREGVSDHGALLTLIAQLDALDGDALEGWLLAHVDVERLLRFVAMNVLFGMPDDYWAMGNNYHLYFPPGGRAELIPWDYDHGLGGGWGGEPAWDHAGIAAADVFRWKNLNAAFGVANARHPLVDRVLARPRLRARYAALLEAFADPAAGLFALADYERVFAEQAALYAPWLANDIGEGEVMIEDGTTAWYFATRLRALAEQLGLPGVGR